MAGEAINGALPRLRRVKEHHRSLPYAEVADALRTVNASGASKASKLCLTFLTLTASRYGEARGARWGEIDLEGRAWIVPANRMKSNREHRVPLSNEAIAILKQARGLGRSDLVFASPRGGELSDMTLTKVLRTTGLAERCTVHGMRTSFRNWAAESGKPRETAEAALAHVVGGVEGAYFRSDLFELRRDLMEAWAAFIRG